MTATAGDTSGSVLLRLSSSGDGDTAALRQQLALCLATGITQIRVDVRDLDDLGLPALQALQGVGDYLRRKGGALTVVGAGDHLVGSITRHHLEQLLPSASATPAPPADEPHHAPSPTSRAPAPVRALPHQEHAR